MTLSTTHGRLKLHWPNMCQALPRSFCVFRSKKATQSGKSQPAIPESRNHLFRLIAATQTEKSRPGIPLHRGYPFESLTP
jgi:hypothetical protein